MRPFAKLLGTVGLAAILVSAPLLAQDVITDYDHSYSFNKIKTYSWGKVQILNPQEEPLVVAALDNALQGYGFKESAKTGETGKSGDMIVTVVQGNRPQQYVAFYRGMNNLDWQRGWGSKGFSDSATSLRQIHGGTLVVDFYDGATGKLIWRGTAAESPGASETMTQDKANKTVRTLLTAFPLKSGVPNQLPPRDSQSYIPTTSPN
jgi:hypothetical protein